jgi:hypothetical protein
MHSKDAKVIHILFGNTKGRETLQDTGLSGVHMKMNRKEIVYDEGDWIEVAEKKFIGSLLLTW